jgi:hypothetical protein
MLTLYGDLDSGNVYKVRLLLAQLGIAHRRVDTPTALPFAEGPRVRIRLPPAESRQRTVLPSQAIGCTAPPAVVRRKISPRAHGPPGRRVMMPATRSS